MSYTWLSQWMCTGGWSFHIKCVWWILDQGGRPNLFEMSQIINHARRPITSNGSFHKCRENIILSARNVKTVHIHHSLYCSSCIQLQEEETLFWLEGDFNYWFFFFFQTKVCDWRTDLPLQWSDAWRCHRRDGPRAGGESQHRSAGRGPSLKHTHMRPIVHLLRAIPMNYNIVYGIWLIPLTWLAESRLICGPLLVLYCGQLQLS